MKLFLMSLIILLMPQFILNANSSPQIIEGVKIQNDLASIHDFIESLEGTITVDEEEVIYTFELNDVLIKLDLTSGYSIVNNQPVPYLLMPSEMDEKVINIIYFVPHLINEQIFVPIQFIERVFNVQYDAEQGFILPVDVTGEVKEEVEESSDIEKTKTETADEGVEAAPITPTPPASNSKPHKPNSTPTPKPEDPQPNPEPEPETPQPNPEPDPEPETPTVTN